jgi:hypothetical protein
MSQNALNPSVLPEGMKAPQIVTVKEVTDLAYTLLSGDDYLMFNNGSAQTVTVPPDLTSASFPSVPFPIGDVINGTQKGAGQVTFAPGVGVTINSLSGHLAISGQYGMFTLVKEATNVWKLSGNLA